MTTVVVVRKAGQIAIAADTLVTFGDTRLAHRFEDNTKVFKVETEENRRTFVLDRAREMRAKIEKDGMPALNQHALLGPTARERLGNVMTALERGAIAPIEMIARVA